MDMGVSREGLGFLERHEGVVLKVYRDAAGVLTIGAGLTAKSGVIVPKPGMTITAGEASRLLALALTRNYEPAVRRAMPGAVQHEFDGGVSFHFNTGAIGRASWVKAWLKGDDAGTRKGLALWKKGGGRVLPGLVRRREEEANLIIHGVYAAQSAKPKRRPGMAVITLRLDAVEMAAVRKALKALGYDPGPDPAFVAEGAVRAFQEAHDLTVDGILGRATLATLQRRLDARTKTGTVAAAGGAGTAATQAPGMGDIIPQSDMASLLVLAGIAVAALWLAWSYRDVVAAKVQRLAPKSAAWLRSK